MAIEDHGTYVTGTPEEIGQWKDQQIANKVGGVAATAAVGVTIAGAAAIVAMVKATRQAKSQLASYRQFYQVLRPDFADEILKKSVRSGFLKSSLYFAFFMAIGVSFALAVDTTVFIGFAVAGLVVGAILFGRFRMGYLGGAGMRMTHKAVCPHCHKETPIIGYGMCRHCFGFLFEQNRQEIMGMTDVPLPVKREKLHLTSMARVLTDSFFTRELKATKRYSPGSNLDKDIDHFCASVANPKPVPQDAVILVDLTTTQSPKAIKEIEKNNAALAGFILSMIALLSLVFTVAARENDGAMGFGLILFIPTTISGLICSIIGLARSKKVAKAKRHTGFAIVGLVIPVLFVVLLIVAGISGAFRPCLKIKTCTKIAIVVK